MSVDGKIPTYSLYDSDYVKYWRYLGWEDQRQSWATRHQTSFIFETAKPIFDNINALLSHFNGILSYSNGKYTFLRSYNEQMEKYQINIAQYLLLTLLSNPHGLIYIKYYSLLNLGIKIINLLCVFLVKTLIRIS